MAPKLAEMDEIVKMIHMSSLNDQGRTLLVAVNDHGMTENGNHGGSSFEEADSLALFVGLRGHPSDYLSATQNTAQQPRIIACGNTIVAFAMGVRFLIGPAVMAAASMSIGLRGSF